MGTANLLHCALDYWQGLAGQERQAFRFLHVSTDEVFGSLGPDDAPFREDTPYAPQQPLFRQQGGQRLIWRGPLAIPTACPCW